MEMREIPKMSKEQFNYAKALASFETIKAQVDKEKHPYQNNKDLSIEEWAEKTTEIEFRYNYWKAFELKVQAEKVLVAWARDYLKEQKPGDYEKVKRVFEAPIYNEPLRQKLIKLCFLLKA